VVARLVPPLGQHWQRELTPNPSRFADQPDSDQRPVEQVSWDDAMEFCRRLNSLLPPSAGCTYTLPSEAQWEYACRAGTTTPFAFGETLGPELAKYDGTVSYANGPVGVSRGATTPVGSFPANGWGLHDMHGNVWEWCLDHWHDSYQGAPFDGGAWLSSDVQEADLRRLLRGGSWDLLPRRCRSASRYGDHPDNPHNDCGFRVCCLPQDSASLHLNL
jgi:formylglycine-generating enzyme required for sulfatase activity